MNPRAFSTLGCPGADLDEVVRLAMTGPCEGVELRCAPGQLVHPGMPDAEADEVAVRLTAAGLDAVCLASYVQVAADRTDVVADLAGVLRLASRLGAPRVRVFGGGAETEEGRRDRAVRQLSRAAPLAEELGVDLLLETHDTFLTGARIADVLEAVASPAVGAVWDAVNPWRAGEPPERTTAVLGPWIRHVQFKDVATPTDLRPVLPGHGTLPLAAVADSLRGLGYRGWISLEWERAWYPEAAPLAQALTAFHQLLDAVGTPTPARTPDPTTPAPTPPERPPNVPEEERHVPSCPPGDRHA